MFHVKHFCPIGAENLTSMHTRSSFKHVGLRKKLWTLPPRAAQANLKAKILCLGWLRISWFHGFFRCAGLEFAPFAG